MRVERVVNGFDSALRLHDDAMTMASIYVWWWYIIQATEIIKKRVRILVERTDEQDSLKFNTE
jgi:hypothetical protein